VLFVKLSGGKRITLVVIGAANAFLECPSCCHFSNVIAGGEDSYHD
jgi:hypothetical protein